MSDIPVTSRLITRGWLTGSVLLVLADLESSYTGQMGKSNLSFYR